MTVSDVFDVILLAPTVATIEHLLAAAENVLRTSNTPSSSVAEGDLLSIVSSNYLAGVNTLQSLINGFKLTSGEESVNNT